MTSHQHLEARGDVRLAKALSILDRESIDVLSLDVFDTVLWRTVPEPSDAFAMLGRHLAGRGLVRPHVEPDVFAAVRRAAEERARLLHADPEVPEVTLEEIYERVPWTLVTADAHRLAEAEVEFEATITFPDLEVAALAAHAQRAYGVRVALVSDTYFSPEQLRRLVDGAAWRGIDVAGVFTSSAHRTGKSQKLFEVVLGELGADPARVLHVGDHQKADVEAPAELGIHTVHFEKFHHGLDQVITREDRLLGGAAGRAGWLDPEHGDFGLTAIRSKSAMRVDTVDVVASVTGYWGYGASILGPLFAGFAEWTHRRAQEEGVDTVFCAMREGEFLSRLVNGAAGYLESPVRARPIWLSRRVCEAAAIGEASEDELRRALYRKDPPTVRQFCESLGVQPGQAAVFSEHADGRMDDDEIRELVIEAILDRDDVRASIVARSAEIRRRLVDYFLRTVGDKAERVMLADLGWAGTIQGNLAVALSLAGCRLHTIGLYLLTSEGARSRVLDGVQAEGFLASAGVPGRLAWAAIRSPEVLEQTCMVDEGSLVGFTEAGEPVLGPVDQSPVQMLQRNAVQRGIVGFQQEWARYRHVLPVERHSLDGAARNILRGILLRSIVEPTATEAAMFSTWLHDDNFGGGAGESVVSEEIARTVRHMTPHQLMHLPMHRVYWPYAVAALAAEELAEATSAVASGLVAESAFTAPEPFEVQIDIDYGEGFKDARSVDVPLNGGGLGFLREEIWHPMHTVRLTFSGHPCIVRLDSFRLRLSVRDRVDTFAFDAQWPEEFAALGQQSGVRLAPNVFLGQHAGPAIVFSAPDLGAPIYKLDLEVAFAPLTLPAVELPGGSAPPPVPATHLVRRAGSRAKAVVRTAMKGA